MSKPFIIKIMGASNCGNVGDDLISKVLLDTMNKSVGEMATIELISNPWSYTDIATADVLVIGGGGLIYDYDMANVDNYCNAIHIANNFRIPVYMVGIGVQHVFSEEAKEKYAQALPIVRAIVSRGKYDTQQIRALGYRGKVVQSKDLVFLTNEAKDYTPATRKRPRIILSLSDWKLGSNYEKIQSNLQQDYKKYRLYIESQLSDLKSKYDIMIFCQAKEDRQLSKRLASTLGVPLYIHERVDDAYQLLTSFAEADLVITNRYHGFIGACVTQTPVIAVSFSGHKTQNLINESFPTLKGQYFTIEEFVKQNILHKLSDTGYFEGLKTASARELHAAASQARNHETVFEMIAGEIYILGGDKNEP